MQLRVENGRARLFTRRGFDWTQRYPLPVAAAARLKVASLTIDCELIVEDERGVPDFSMLHSRVHDRHARLVAFDVLEHDGEDLRLLPFSDRKKRLKKIIRKACAPGIQICEHLEGDGAVIFAKACELGLEGIVSKKLTSTYRAGRSSAWLKTRNKLSPGYMRVRDGTDG